MVNTASAPVNLADGEYLSITAAAKLWGMSPITIQRKRKAAGVAVFTSKADDRLRLMSRAALVELLGQPGDQSQR